MTIVPVTSANLEASEVSWFSALCGDDYRYLGVPESALAPTWAHCSTIVKTAEAQGFRNVLCPSSYQVGQDVLTFVAGMAPLTKDINLLAAIRCGELQPLMLARTVAALDHMLEGRLTLNVISSDFPGEKSESKLRYRRSHEVVEVLRQCWTRDTVDYEGEFYNFKGVTTAPATPYQTGGPLLYFGGYSPDALELCGAQCDVYLMWPETKDVLAERMKAVNERAAAHGRTLDYGLRVHVVVRDTEAEAREYAESLVEQARRRIRAPDPRAQPRFNLAGRQPSGPRPRTGRRVRLCRAASVDRHRAGAVRLRGGHRRLCRSGAERNRGIPQDGHPRLHLFGLSAHRRGGTFRPSGDAAPEHLFAAPRLWKGAGWHPRHASRNRRPPMKSTAPAAAPCPRVQITDSLDFSRIVYGMWRLGDDADTSPAHVQAKVEACLEQGITTLDQADIYGGYMAEEILGAAFRAAPALKDKVEIVTKCDIVVDAGRHAGTRIKHYDTSRAHIMASVDASLSLMDIDRIDLLLIHRPDPLIDPDETGRALDDLVSQGKVGAVGVSNFRPWDIELLESRMTNTLVANQIELSLGAHRPLVDGDVAFVHRTGRALMAWSPLGGGSLMAGAQPKVTQMLRDIAEASGTDAAAVAVAWLLAHPAGVLPVMGTNTLSRIARLTDAFRVDIDRQTWFGLYEAALGHEVA